MRRTLASVLSALLAVLAITMAASPPAWSTTWSLGLQPASNAQAKAQPAPSAPGAVAATCTSGSSTTVAVSWGAVPHATFYTVYRSTTAATGPYSMVWIVAGTSWTTGSLGAGSYWFEVKATVGAQWTSPLSAATAQRTITGGTCA